MIDDEHPVGTDDIQATILIEDLVAKHPRSVYFLMLRGIVCIACGEPVWGTLEEAAQRKGFTDEEIRALVEDLNREFGDGAASGSEPSNSGAAD